MSRKVSPISVLITLLTVSAVAGIGWRILQAPVRLDSAATASTPHPEPSPTPVPVLIDFEFLDQTVPDQQYRPVYPERLEALDGHTVRIRGFMTPYDDLENLNTFLIMGFPTGCNFCAPPSVSQVVLARHPPRWGPMAPHAYVDGPIEVTGVLRLWSPDSEDPAHRDEYFLYIMEDVNVESLPPEAFRPPREHRLMSR